MTTKTTQQTPSNLLELMAARKNIAPKRLVSPGPDLHQLELIFKAASHAPDHGQLNPWRFITVPDSKRNALGSAFVAALKTRDSTATQEQIDASYSKAFRAPCIVFSTLNLEQSNPQIPKAERLISLGCAIQNMLLMAKSLNIGSGITSGQAVNSKYLRELFSLSELEEGICFLNFGTIESEKPNRSRPNPSSFVSSL